MKCLQCDTDTNNPKFCSNKCQQEKQKALIIERWLTTGVAKLETHAGACYKEYVMREQNNLCAICGWPNTWNGQPLTFNFDHIDGDSTNNKRTNLRCICPHCDSQLPTSKGRNRGRGRHWRRVRYAEGKSR